MKITGNPSELMNRQSFTNALVQHPDKSLQLQYAEIHLSMWPLYITEVKATRLTLPPAAHG